MCKTSSSDLPCKGKTVCKTNDFLNRCIRDPVTGCWRWPGRTRPKLAGKPATNAVMREHSGIECNSDLGERWYRHCNDGYCFNPDHIYKGHTTDASSALRVNSNIHEYIREALAYTALTQKQIAIMFGVSVSTVAGVLRRYHDPRLQASAQLQRPVRMD